MKNRKPLYMSAARRRAHEIKARRTSAARRADAVANAIEYAAYAALAVVSAAGLAAFAVLWNAHVTLNMIGG